MELCSFEMNVSRYSDFHLEWAATNAETKYSVIDSLLDWKPIGFKKNQYLARKSCSILSSLKLQQNLILANLKGELQ